MSTYLLNFIVYTAAMIGIIFMAVFVYKKFSLTTSSKSKFLNVEECISLAPRKELFVVRAGNERFLVASDVGRTTLISKLSGKSASYDYNNEIQSQTNLENSASVLKSSNKCSVDDLPTIVDFQKASAHKAPKKVFKNIINNI